MEDYKEVRFDKYCKTCKHEKVAEEKDPCHLCLAVGMNYQSEKPTKWEAKDASN